MENATTQKGGMVGCTGRPKDSVDQSMELTRSLEELNNLICRYDKIVGMLSSKLDTVMIPVPPCSIEASNEIGYQTQMANRVNQMRCTMRDITNVLESICERVEL